MIKGPAFLLFILLAMPVGSRACECAGPFEFDSKKDLRDYSFIALVGIDSIYTGRDTGNNGDDLFYHADLTILELFKGQPLRTIRVSGGNPKLGGTTTSCDIGIESKQKWVLFGYEDREGHIRVGRCTFSEIYANSSGERDWQRERGIRELNTLRGIYRHKHKVETPKEGWYTTYYPGGATEIRQMFRNGLADGQKTIYYSTGEIMVDEHYSNGLRSGRSIWLDREGNKLREYHYREGQPVGTCYDYWFYYGGLRTELVYDQNGKLEKRTEFRSDGSLKEIMESDLETGRSIISEYYGSGNVERVTVKDDVAEIPIKKTEYYEHNKPGAKFREWVFFPNDRKKLYEYWQWTGDGRIAEHYIYMRNKLRINQLD